MMTEGGAIDRGQRRTAMAFWWRLSDNLFRHIVWFVLPVLALGAIGFMQASKALQLYESAGVLSASSNPLVPDQQIAGTNAQYWESTAAAASRTINEQLRTDKFMLDVAGNAGLQESVETGELDLDIVRSSVWSSADGSSLVQVRASWNDPQTAYALVQSTIDTYQTFLAETVASDSSEAVDFYTLQLTQYEGEAEAAEEALVEFVDGLPAESDPTLAETLQLQRFTDEVTSAEAKVAAAQNEIESAMLIVAQSKSEAGRSLTVIDAPQVATSPESTLVEQIMTVVSYTMLGIVIAIGALLVSTVLDQSVSSPSDLMIGGVSLVATVPPLRLPVASGEKLPSKRSESRKRKRSRTVERESVGV